MKDTYLLKSEYGKKLYTQAVKDLPIIDYHCHLSPKEIYEDKTFDNIGEMWLSGDHYKWRLMREFGIDEEYITGKASWRDKFQKYAQTIALAGGNPLYHWTQMELYKYFGIETQLNGRTAQEIWEKANAIINKQHLSPRKLIVMSNVQYIATTDDITDDLLYHKKIREDKSFKVTVVPSFRTDNLFLIYRPYYADYIKKLSLVSGIEINDINTFKSAIVNRLDFFTQNGCKFSDVGIEYFPDCISSQDEVSCVFLKILTGNKVDKKEYMGFLGYMYMFLAKEYKKRKIVMQWHLAVKRNANTAMFEKLGVDCGGDCMGDVIPGENIIRMLDKINSAGLPKTILYSLNPVMCPSLSTIAGSYRDVLCGAAWWFCDHKRGIIQQIQNISETGHIATFLGMLTDSRSFLSYARHDYFRRIMCDVIGQWVEDGEFSHNEDTIELAKRICYTNIKTLIEGE